VNLGLLIAFKYYGFLTTSAENLLGDFNLVYQFPQLDILLPVGISFYTFQTLSYTIDVYRGTSEPERHFGIFSLYVAFFPQLVAGPIERSYRLLPQLRQWVTLNYVNVRNGLCLMAFGFFKKVVVADRLAEYVNAVYNNPIEHGGFSTIIATYFFAFQIYCDFSGYSDIAIGAALVLGVQLMTNFRQPYFSRDIGEFWARWHISLSTWFKDYVYIPLGGNRNSKWRWYYNLMVVFVISGLWHGADWNFVIWGMLHGLFIIGSVIAQGRSPYRDSDRTIVPACNWKTWLQVFFTFHLVLLGWVFFRANNVSDAILIIKNSFDISFFDDQVNLFRFQVDFPMSVVLIVLLLVIDYLQLSEGFNKRLRSLHSVIKWALLVFGLLTIMVLGKFNGADFLYFQF
jgi:D-alanyl-lipoteichoic acid acyltransferase DltB (MBOAT superfamily)